MRILLALVLLAAMPAGQAAARSLEIYFIDVEGGQATLLVTPDRQSFLIDTGFPDNADRIVAAARDAGIQQIDYLMITHFHPDHDGGVVGLSKSLPIQHFIDHETLLPEARKDAGLEAAYESYLEVRKGHPHITPKPGDRLPLTGIDVEVVSSAGAVLTKPLAGAGKTNALCGSAAVPPRDTLENPRSTGVVVTLGKFRFLDVGDLTGQPLFDLACPKSLIGPVDVYLVAHHGGPDVAAPELFAAFAPRVAIMNNGLTKGGAKTTYEALHHVDGLADVWQIHKSEAAAEQNFADDHIANLNEKTTHWIKLSAQPDGSFQVVNARTGQRKTYPPSGR